MTATKLNEEELRAYREKGWVVPSYRLPEAVIAEMRAEYDALLTLNAHLESDIMLAPHQTNGGSQGVI